MGKTLKYVSEFSFPSDKGYSGSAGKTMVKGYARGGSCGPMKKADGGMVDDPRRPMMDRTVGEYINAVNRERAMERAMKLEERQRLFGGPLTIDEARAIFGPGEISNAERRAMEQRAPRRISQGLRSPTAEMARERAIMGEDAGYKKGGMAMRKQYPTNNGKPMISGPKAAPAPKADMLYSKKEVNAKNLLRDGKAPALPHAKGSVNMKSGGTVKKAIGGVMPGGGKMTQSQMQAAAQGGRPGVSVARMQTTPSPLSQSDLRVMQEAAQQNKGEIRIPPKEIMQQALSVRPRGVGGPPPQGINRPSGLTQSQANQVLQGLLGVRPRGAGGPPPQAIDPKRPIGGAMPKPGQVGSATGSTPNIGGVPGRVMAKGGAAKVGKVMREFKAGELHSGSKSGPVVKSRKQAIAIGLSEARRGKK
jgi:hypothetical protein